MERRPSEAGAQGEVQPAVLVPIESTQDDAIDLQKIWRDTLPPVHDIPAIVFCWSVTGTKGLIYGWKRGAWGKHFLLHGDIAVVQGIVALVWVYATALILCLVGVKYYGYGAFFVVAAMMFGLGLKPYRLCRYFRRLTTHREWWKYVGQGHIPGRVGLLDPLPPASTRPNPNAPTIGKDGDH